MACVPIGAWFWLRRRFDLAWRDISVGAAVFIVFALVLERMLHLYLLQLNPVTAQWLRAPALFVIYGALMAGLFEETGRWLGPTRSARRPGRSSRPSSSPSTTRTRRSGSCARTGARSRR